MIGVVEFEDQEFSFADDFSNGLAGFGSEIFLFYQSGGFVGERRFFYLQREKVGELGFYGFDFG